MGVFVYPRERVQSRVIGVDLSQMHERGWRIKTEGRAPRHLMNEAAFFERREYRAATMRRFQNCAPRPGLEIRAVVTVRIAARERMPILGPQ